MKTRPNREKEFLERMTRLLGAQEARRLTESLQTVSPKSVRYNRRVSDPHALKGKTVPWCSPYGRFWDRPEMPSRTVDYALGAYYIQESSAMLAVALAEQVMDFSGKRVADLTAAPGGKACQMAELILPNGFLLANEVISKRAEPLIWNVCRHRLNNVVIASVPTAHLSSALPGFFDIILADAPCSGEGLISRQKHSLENWSENNIRACASRQAVLLREALDLLKPGGFLIYSTCTFAVEENEEQVERLLGMNMIPVPLPEDAPASPAISDNPAVRLCSRRIFPHREGGAGAFAAILQKKATEETCPEPAWIEHTSDAFRFGGDLFPHLDLREARGYFFEKNGIASLFQDPRIPAFLYRNSLQMGAPFRDKRRDNPAMYGGVQLANRDFFIEADESAAMEYVNGGPLPSGERSGYYWISYKNEPLGPALYRRGQAINLFPKALRPGGSA